MERTGLGGLAGSWTPFVGRPVFEAVHASPPLSLTITPLPVAPKTTLVSVGSTARLGTLKLLSAVFCHVDPLSGLLITPPPTSPTKSAGAPLWVPTAAAWARRAVSPLLAAVQG